VTFLKINNDVILEEGMNIYIGNKFGFRITSIEKNVVYPFHIFRNILV
jgi:hypothetical protein